MRPYLSPAGRSTGFLGHSIEGVDAAVGNRPADTMRSLPVRRMKSELDIADDNRGKAGAISNQPLQRRSPRTTPRLSRRRQQRTPPAPPSEALLNPTRCFTDRGRRSRIAVFGQPLPRTPTLARSYLALRLCRTRSPAHRLTGFEATRHTVPNVLPTGGSAPSRAPNGPTPMGRQEWPPRSAQTSWSGA